MSEQQKLVDSVLSFASSGITRKLNRVMAFNQRLERCITKLKEQAKKDQEFITALKAENEQLRKDLHIEAYQVD